VLDLKAMRFLVASAGHLSPLHYKSAENKAVSWNISTGPPLGTFPDSEYPLHEQRVQKGDKILFFTDGITECMDEKQEEFGEVRLMEVFGENGGLPPQEIMSAITDAFNAYAAREKLNDDWTALIAEMR